MLRWWQDYFESTKINRATSAEFGIKALSYEALDYDRNPFLQCEAEIPLAQPSWRERAYVRLSKNRRSTRKFSPSGLTLKQLGTVLTALRVRPDGKRNYASAGALYPVHTFVVDLRGSLSAGESKAAAYRYDPESHALGRLCYVGSVERAREVLGVVRPEEVSDSEDRSGSRIGGREGSVSAGVSKEVPGGSGPSLVLVFVADLGEVTRKYGARGTRFALLEAGAMAHAVGLSLAAVGLVGYEVGGTFEDETLQLLGLSDVGGVVLHAIAVGRAY